VSILCLIKPPIISQPIEMFQFHASGVVGQSAAIRALSPAGQIGPELAPLRVPPTREQCGRMGTVGMGYALSI
jgi:hypothetical protein